MILTTDGRLPLSPVEAADDAAPRGGASSSIRITFNGAARQVAAETSVAALLVELGLTARHLAVEVNQNLVPRGQHARHALAEGDRVEVVTLVGGLAIGGELAEHWRKGE